MPKYVCSECSILQSILTDIDFRFYDVLILVDHGYKFFSLGAYVFNGFYA